jgi:hypothetical protein
MNAFLKGLRSVIVGFDRIAGTIRNEAGAINGGW